jgi:4-nitrophenyl phosphatase
VEALEVGGFEVVDDGPADAVVVGFTRAFDFDHLARAADIVRAGALLVATNLDATYPAAHGLLPGAGSLVASVATASGTAPEVAGKPAPATAAFVRARLGDDGLVIGDRPSTDGALAAALGWPFALVLSGVAGTPGEEGVPDPPPAFVAADLAALAPVVVAAYDGQSRPG